MARQGIINRRLQRTNTYKMEKIKLFTGEDFDGNIEYSTRSYQDLIDNSPAHFMPGGFVDMEVSEKQFRKLEETDGDGVPTHYLTRSGRIKSL